MNSKPFISIIIPCYNRAGRIAKTLKSLQDQDYGDYEIIVVDDGSTDDTEGVIKGLLNERTRYYKKVNGERAAARNDGARLAKGDYLNFFDSDDIALPHHLSEAARLIAAKHHPEWFHLAYQWADGAGRLTKAADHFSSEYLNEVLADGNHLGVAGVFIRKEIFLQHPFNEDRALSASEDYELWLRLAARYPLHYSNTVTTLYIDHKTLADRKTDDQELINRINLLLHYLHQDKAVMERYKKLFHKVRMDAHSYIALYLAEKPAYKLKSIYYMLVAAGDSLRYLAKRRFYATVKKLFFQW